MILCNWPDIVFLAKQTDALKTYHVEMHYAGHHAPEFIKSKSNSPC